MAAQTPHVAPDARVTDLRLSLRDLAAAPADGLQAAAEVAELLAAQAELTVAITARLAAVDAAGVWQDTGSKAQWAWLVRHATGGPRPELTTDTTDPASATAGAAGTDGGGSAATGVGSVPARVVVPEQAPMSRGAAQKWVALMRGLPLRPHVHEALSSAGISRAHAEVLLTALDELERVTAGTGWHTPEWLESMEVAFTDLARLTDPVTLHRELGKRLQALAPEPAAKDAEDQLAQRKASLTPGLGGTWQLTGSLDPHSGQLIKTALEAWRRTDQTADDPRTPAQRDVDALVGICQAWLERGETTRRGVAPHLVVHVPEARMAAHQVVRDALGLPVTCPETGERMPDPFLDPLFTRDGQLISQQEAQEHLERYGPERTSELLDLVPPATYSDGTPVPEVTVAELLCTADLTRLVLDTDSAVLDVGRARRVFDHPQWLAVMHTWQQQCATDGCLAPASRLDLHHAVWWRDGGTTDLANAIPLCHGRQSCHTRVHAGDTLRLRDGRLLDRRGLHHPDQDDHASVWPPPLRRCAPRLTRTRQHTRDRLHRILPAAVAAPPPETPAA